MNKQTLGWIIGVFVLFPLFVFLYNKVTVRKNDGAKSFSAFYEKIISIQLDVPKLGGGYSDTLNIEFDHYRVGASPLATSLGIATGTYDYATGNYDFKKGRYTDALTNEGASPEEDLDGEISSATRDQFAGAVAGGGKGSLEAVEVITNQNRTIIREVIDQEELMLKLKE